MFNKILVANRGEIACRIFRTCRRLGIQSVAVYSSADAQAQHVRLADEAYEIGAPESALSYLDHKKIIAVAKKAKVQAIHPGYGFLSENDLFADELEKAKINFIGPSGKVMNRLGDKIEAKKIAKTAGVPMVPSLLFKSSDPKKMLAEAQAFAEKYAFPIMIKAAAGGGGRGMRQVHSKAELADKLASAAREAQAAFGDGRLFIEKLVQKARHVEVQIIGDLHGNVLSLFDRDCSMQRNHQKVIEEAPAPHISDKVREKMQKAARDLCAEAGYYNAGTVEFLLTPQEEFYFLEVNSRLQVEHPVTEAITGLDLVELQLRVASGEKLKDLVPKDLRSRGAAIECRLCAEVPEENFIAAGGRLEAFEIQSIDHARSTLRVDSGFTRGDTVTHYYDSLLAKIIVHADTRDEALSDMRETLSEASICGVKTNIGFLSTLLATPEFKLCSHDTHFAHQVLPTAEQLLKQAELHAGLLLVHRATATTESKDPWLSNSAFRIFSQPSYSLSAAVNGLKVSVQAQREATNTFRLSGSSLRLDIEVISSSPFQLKYTSAMGEGSIRFHVSADATWAMSSHGTVEIKEISPSLKAGKLAQAHSGEISSPLPGKVILVKAAAGDAVTAGDAIVVIESMKMEHIIRAPHDGEVEKLHVKAGQVVEANAVLAQLSPAR
ncbi:MAG: ATP-grasp domain-containing protein [Deltaproteobacteria bacterium]|nr:ATP-grasp domain-containing protein [Deltaproteobacteria bacterium]